jgi:putative toxin-antitoxin system antitoxin component (TIGR02293 family)
MKGNREDSANASKGNTAHPQTSSESLTEALSNANVHTTRQVVALPAGTRKSGRQPPDKRAATNLAELADQPVFTLIQTVRAGVPFPMFQEWAATMPFSPADWAAYLHLSDRTLQRYKKGEATFDALQSEKILEILLLFKKGSEVFEDKENFAAWLQASNVALGQVKPKDLLDSSFGINLLREELIRIEHGVLA